MQYLGHEWFLLENTSDISLRVNPVGISNEFILPTPTFDPTTRHQLLWIAGAIGITCFLLLSVICKFPVPFQIIFVIPMKSLFPHFLVFWAIEKFNQIKL